MHFNLLKITKQLATEKKYTEGQKQTLQYSVINVRNIYK